MMLWPADGMRVQPRAAFDACGTGAGGDAVKRRLCAVLLLLAAGSGCVRQRVELPGVYRLTRVGSGEAVLVPPASVAPDAARQLRMPLGKVKQGKRGNCEARSGVFGLQVVKRQAVVTVDMKDMPAGGSLPLYLLDDMERFRTGFGQLEATRCLGAGQGGALLQRTVEGMALPPRMAYFLRHGTSVNSGYADLEPPFRVKVVTPLRSENVVDGFETAWYGMEARGEGGYRPRLERVEVNGQEVPARVAKQKVLPVGRTGFYRLFFLTRRSVADHDILVVRAATRKLLEEATPRIKAEGVAACAAMKARDLECLPVPLQSAVSAELAATVNGRTVYVPFSGTVADALKAAGVKTPQEKLAALRVQRLYRGLAAEVEFEKGRPDILAVTLVGGESISF